MYLSLKRQSVATIRATLFRTKTKDMKALQPGHDVVSLFESSWRTQAPPREGTNRKLMMSFVNAVLVVLVLGLTLSVIQYFLSSGARAASIEATQTYQTEPVAFQPSRAVSERITAGPGYLQ